jgi:antitoxin (DNA-binding transcriptional repressor) of toxin-antitoxin stability system
MMKSLIPLEEAQGQLPALLAEMYPGQEVFLTQDGHVVAHLVKAQPRSDKPCELGFAKDSIFYMADDFNAPMELRECAE